MSAKQEQVLKLEPPHELKFVGNGLVYLYVWGGAFLAPPVSYFFHVTKHNYV